ncbi:hypothetical protein GCM10009347_42910 [Shewanella algicola]|uniref:Uncharacterized protein n=1 Tax=Shewanella algicola TaxID=640633 RepID=A0A9X2CEI7_9GAMM|nr:hypothetical protein [Shewanella algicola]MCL1107873.1 hypothetical protein [Shewanella algicola]GGP74171.1 hypothetical protein GCM10009347_42910 [Shewanella algicola]
MTTERKQFNDAKAPKKKPTKKKHKKTEKVKSTSSVAANKHATKDDGSNKSFLPSKLVSALFNNERDFKSAIGGKFKLSRDHVKHLGSIVKTSQIELKQALLIIHKNKGYKKLGYADFKAYVENHLKISYDAALKQVWAARVAYEVNGADAIGFFSDNSMLPMKDLTDEEIQDVVEHIEEEYGEDITISGKYTRKIVEGAMRSLGLLDKDNSDVDLEVDDEEAEEDAVEQVNDDLDFDDDKPLAKPKTPTKQSSKVKQTYIEDVVKSESHRQFLEQFKIKAKDSTKIKAIFAAFIETDAGKKPKKVKIAIKLLTKHLKNLKKLEA